MANLAPYLTDGPEQRQIILLKLCHELETAPHFPDLRIYSADSEQRLWLSRAGALLQRIGVHEAVYYRSSLQLISRFGNKMVESIKAQMIDAIAKLQLELHLEGRDDFGRVYEKGEAYRFFSDVCAIVAHASRSILVADPYFNGEAFQGIIGPTDGQKLVRILCDRYVSEVVPLASRFSTQFGSTCQVRQSKEMHDRVIILDEEDCWIVGASIKDGGKKPTYLVPLSPSISPRKVAMYEEIWQNAKAVL